MNSEKRINSTVDLIICDAIKDYAKEENISEGESRERLMSSKAVELFYDTSNGIWTQGPDELIRLYRKIG